MKNGRYYIKISGNTIKTTQNFIFTQVSEHVHACQGSAEWFGWADASNYDLIICKNYQHNLGSIKMSTIGKKLGGKKHNGQILENNRHRPNKWLSVLVLPTKLIFYSCAIMTH